MPEPFLYEHLDAASSMDFLKTGEEKAFVRMLNRQMQKLQGQYEQVYLLRNEGHFAIYNFTNGQAFQPDFVLFLREKSGKLLIYKLFIEPKGNTSKSMTAGKRPS